MLDQYTSTGAKFFAHQEAMRSLRGGRGQPISSHVMLTDACNHTCAFCSVQKRAGDSLPPEQWIGFLDALLKLGLKAVILSGGGNPILYKCYGYDFSDVVDWAHERGLQVGLITNGMPMKDFGGRRSWKTVPPETLDKLTWVRVSMAGLDHSENRVFVPDVDFAKTTLGFSYVAHDIYKEPLDPYHGKVSTPQDLLSPYKSPERPFEDRIPELTEQLDRYVERHHPAYVRLLPNCLEPELIARRCSQLAAMANAINSQYGGKYNPVFVQNKPPKAPKACYLGYVHPVLNCDGWVYPCDSCVLNDSADHQFGNPWRVCRWDGVAELYERPARSLIADPAATCPGCVFSKSNAVLGSVVDGTADLRPPEGPVVHENFV